ncbi:MULTISPECIES: PHB depolymerase family esterase [unclassified Novosphingobium]|uniref:extracellular catalytic domain type 2 short-chain-length polyhydroxyalkanoate depolymerase n=1 Tax=unclassified Novosphingobium TaxID=2644732 RepID=UPI00135B629D|nr:MULTISPECIES: PHB depolymerase family esterase [unclassified Novosphingobium]
MRHLFAAIACLLASLMAPAADADIPPLPHLGTDAQRTSVSGLSSGGFMAVQYAVAFSKSTIGAGIVAGGPYGCGIFGAVDALACMAGSGLSPAGSYSLALNYQAFGLIDPLSNTARQRLYLFHGTADTTVSAATMAALRQFYLDLKVPEANIAYVSAMGANHAFVSDETGNGCKVLGTPFINKCRQGRSLYDQPAAILKQIFGAPPAGNDRPASAPIAFDQSPFRAPLSSFDDTGYLYVPARCRDAAAHCPVHIVFHGCEQGAGTVGDAVYRQLGYNEWAEIYGLVMLYPQVAKSQLMPMNPNGCWDWWGYDGKGPGTFLTRYGTQLSAVNAMVAELAKPAD